MFRGKTARDRRLAFRARKPMDLGGIGINTKPYYRGSTQDPDEEANQAVIHFSRGFAEPDSYQMVMRDPRLYPELLEEIRKCRRTAETT